jgi:hypothetical protein
LEATIEVKLVGKSKFTEISYCILDENEEEKFRDKYPNRITDFYDNILKDNKITVKLPWDKKMNIKEKEILYLQIMPVHFNSTIRLGIWKNGELQSESTIKNNLFPFFKKYQIGSHI